MITKFKNLKELKKKISIILQNKNPIIISGGNTIKNIFNNYNKKISNKILISDERLVKTSSKLRNDLFFKKLVKKKIINSKKIMSYNLGYLDKKFLKNFSKRVEKTYFHFAILSLGKMGHFASIFEFDQYQDGDFYYVNNSPKFPRERVTVSLKKISKCKKIYFIASEKNKKKEIKDFYNNRLINKIPKEKVKLFVY